MKPIKNYESIDLEDINFKDDSIRFYRSDREFGFMSNLYRKEIDFEGRLFPTSEHAYQFIKPVKKEVAEWIQLAPAPHLVAAMSHALLGYDIIPDWSNIKVYRMLHVLRAKFSQHEDMKEQLLATGEKKLIEKSKTDSFWGEGKKGTGKNMLGVLLMHVRTELRTNKAIYLCKRGHELKTDFAGTNASFGTGSGEHEVAVLSCDSLDCEELYDLDGIEIVAHTDKEVRSEIKNDHEIVYSVKGKDVPKLINALEDILTENETG